MHVVESMALKHLDRMTDSTGLIQHAKRFALWRKCSAAACLGAIRVKAGP